MITKRKYHRVNFKEILFRTLAISLPFLFFIILEIALRMFHYGKNMSLFVQDPDCDECWIANKNLSMRYFSDTTNATIGNLESFRKVKEKGTTRIFVLGESTTIGFPYMHNGSFPRWLLYRLLQSYPDQKFEIINLSLTAVNSFTVRDLAKEIVNYQANAVLIYTGHNEYYGALGAASTSNFGNIRQLTNSLIYLRQFRFFQLLMNLRTALFPKRIGSDVRKSLMERMVKDTGIELNSDIYNSGIGNFKANIREACSFLSAHHIPVFLSTVVSNEKDLKPFLSGLRRNAAQVYRLAQASYNKGRYQQSRELFLKAKDFDKLRFRAPADINKCIKEIALLNSGVKLVDSYEVFMRNSPHHVIGNNLLLEHVHPNLDGYALLSDCFFKSLLKSGILHHSDEPPLQLDSLKKIMPITALDSAFGEYQIQFLRRQWPFNESPVIHVPKSFADTLAYEMTFNRITWSQAMDKLMTFYQLQRNYSGMQKVAEAVMLEYPSDPAFLVTAGRLSSQLGDDNKASNYLHRAFVLKPAVKLAQEIFTIDLRRRCLSGAISMINFALQNNPENENLIVVKQRLMQMAEIQNRIDRKFMPRRNLELVSGYQSLGAPEAAKYYQ